MLKASYKTKHFLFLTVKLLLVFAALFFLHYQLVQKGGWSQLNFTAFPIYALIMALILSCCNWFTEFLKWRSLVKSLCSINLSQATKQSLIAFTLGVFTPNKIGEFGIRPLFFQKGLRKKIALLTGMHHFTQLLATLIFGVFGFAFLLFKFPALQKFERPVIATFILGLFVALLLIVIRKKKWVTFPFLNKSIQFVLQIKKDTFVRSFKYSIIRYVIFSHQFYFLLYVFNLEYTYVEVYAGITTVYFLSTLLPAISFFDIVVKASIGILVFDLLAIDEVIVIQVMALMWLLNYVLPLLLGSVYVLQLRYPANNNTWKVL